MTAKVALVTGAARRIGADIARAFHRAGFDIALHYNSSVQDAQALADELNSQRPDSAALFQAELSNITAVKTMADTVLAWRGKLNVLINNASSFYPTPLADATEQDWDHLIGSNLKGPYFLCQSVADSLRANSGSIVNIADIYARKPLSNHSIYCIAKAGNVMLTKSLAKELAPNVRVNGIAPGAILWPHSDEPITDEARQKILSKVPLGRIGSTDDIANTALFLATVDSYCTGQIIAVDGGSSLS